MGDCDGRKAGNQDHYLIAHAYICIHINTYENPEARIFCGMAADRKYELKPLGHFLKQAVEAKIKQLQTSGEWDDRVQKAAETVKKILSERQ